MELYFILAEIMHPINCILLSEDVPSISIVLSNRGSHSLKGDLLINNNKKGNFYTHRPTKEKPTSWTFEKKNIRLIGEAILLKDEKVWHKYQTEIKSHEVNRVLFSELSSKLSSITNERDLLKATAGFFRIGNECYGGRVNKV